MAIPSHKLSSNHYDDIRISVICGCFHCCRKFLPKEINEWVDDGNTALCPYCGVDAVLGNASGWAISETLLIDMYRRWFLELE